MIEIRFESDDFVLMLFRDTEAALGKGVHDALERIPATYWTVDPRYMRVVEELIQSMSANGSRSAGQELRRSVGFWVNGRVKEKNVHTAAFPHRAATSPLTPKSSPFTYSDFLKTEYFSMRLSAS